MTTTSIILIALGVSILLLPFVFWIFRNIMIFIFRKDWQIFRYLKWFVTAGVLIGIIFVLSGILVLVL